MTFKKTYWIFQYSVQHYEYFIVLEQYLIYLNHACCIFLPVHSSIFYMLIVDFLRVLWFFSRFTNILRMPGKQVFINYS